MKQGTPLAEVRGPYNAIRVVGDAVGDTLFYGRGAGQMPTASAVVGDLIDVVVGRRRADLAGARPLARVGRRRPARLAPRRSGAGTTCGSPSPTDPACSRRSPTSSATTAISIASVIQHDPGDDAPEDSPVPLVIMTHAAVEAELARGARRDRPPRRRPRAERLLRGRGIRLRDRNELRWNREFATVRHRSARMENEKGMNHAGRENPRPGIACNLIPSCSLIC